MSKSNVIAKLGVLALFLGTALEVQAQSWTYTGSMASRRVYHTATLLNNGQVLVAGGEFKGSYGLNTAELYNPSTGTFSSTGLLNTKRERHTATALNNGLVLIVGGQYNVFSTSGSYYVCLTSAELYNPATGTFTNTGSMQTPRCDDFTATLLDDGTVLIAGGYNTTSGVVGSAELYNPSTGTFSTVGNLQSARSGHAAALLPNGEVLVAGGCNSTTCFNSAELYNPATGTFFLTGSMSTARSLLQRHCWAMGKCLRPLERRPPVPAWPPRNSTTPQPANGARREA